MQGDLFKKTSFLSTNSKRSWLYFSGLIFGFGFILPWYAVSGTLPVSWEWLKSIWFLGSIFSASSCQSVPLLHSTLNYWRVQIPSGQFLLQPPRSGDKGCSILDLFIWIFLWISVHSYFPGKKNLCQQIKKYYRCIKKKKIYLEHNLKFCWKL